jgi:hypothetical protein
MTKDFMMVTWDSGEIVEVTITPEMRASKPVTIRSSAHVMLRPLTLDPSLADLPALRHGEPADPYFVKKTAPWGKKRRFSKGR